jgi:UDP-N-acetylglucosamine acyltransferase
MIHPLASIDPNAKIAENVTIGPFTFIEGDVEIGEGTWIGSNVTIFNGAKIGRNCKIYPGAVIASTPQDLKFEGEKTYVKVGDNTDIRECVTISRGTKDRFETIIGANCLLMAYVHIAHDCIVGNNCILANAVQLAGHVIIDDFAIVGGVSAVHQFVKIGAHSMVSGGSLVRKDVPPYTKAGREPLSYAGINSIGLRRRGFSNDKINEIQEIYRFLFLKGLNNSKALEAVETELPASHERDLIITFFRESDRGVMKGYAK